MNILGIDNIFAGSGGCAFLECFATSTFCTTTFCDLLYLIESGQSDYYNPLAHAP